MSKFKFSLSWHQSRVQKQKINLSYLCVATLLTSLSISSFAEETAVLPRQLTSVVSESHKGHTHEEKNSDVIKLATKSLHNEDKLATGNIASDSIHTDNITSEEVYEEGISFSA
ncbi:MAG: hypothetical protein WBC60_18780 [Cognaticolwellia sp.]